MDDMLQFHLLNKNQHGFWKGYSTETAISETVTFIENRILNNQFCLGVFLDIQAAFDSIDPKHIKDKLLEQGCPEEIANWYHSYLTYRHIYIKGKNATYETTGRVYADDSCALIGGTDLNFMF